MKKTLHLTAIPVVPLYHMCGLRDVAIAAATKKHSLGPKSQQDSSAQCSQKLLKTTDIIRRLYHSQFYILDLDYPRRRLSVSDLLKFQ